MGRTAGDGIDLEDHHRHPILLGRRCARPPSPEEMDKIARIPGAQASCRRLSERHVGHDKLIDFLQLLLLRSVCSAALLSGAAAAAVTALAALFGSHCCCFLLRAAARRPSHERVRSVRLLLANLSFSLMACHSPVS